MSDKDIQLVRDLLDNYRLLLFNRKKLGDYRMKQVLGIELEDADEVMNDLQASIEDIKDLPLYGELYYGLIYENYVEPETKTKEEIAQDLNVSVITAYRHRQKAIQLIADIFMTRQKGVNKHEQQVI